MMNSVRRCALKGSSETHNVQASELAHDRCLKTLSVIVVFLDDTQHSFQIEKRSKGSALLEFVFQHLELSEKKYFGLLLSDNGAVPSSSSADQMKWLDPSEPVKKQFRSGHFYFRVKFYVSDPCKLQEYTRHHFYLQIRQDVMQGRLQLPRSTACLLASYTVQSELGDYQPDEHRPGYLQSLQLFPGLTEEMEKKIIGLHKLHKGQTPADAKYNFLDHAKTMDMYGVDLHPAKDSTNKDIQLGASSVGLVVFQNGLRINTFLWSKIVKVLFKQRQFLIRLEREPSKNYGTLLGFKMTSYRSLKNLWESSVEYHSLYRLHSPRIRSGRFPHFLGFRFTYSGRREFKTVEKGRQRACLGRTLFQSPNKLRMLQTVPGSRGDRTKHNTPVHPLRSHKHEVTSQGARKPCKALSKAASPTAKSPNKLRTLQTGPGSRGDRTKHNTPVHPLRSHKHEVTSQGARKPCKALSKAASPTAKSPNKLRTLQTGPGSRGDRTKHNTPVHPLRSHKHKVTSQGARKPCKALGKAASPTAKSPNKLRTLQTGPGSRGDRTKHNTPVHPLCSHKHKVTSQGARKPCKALGKAASPTAKVEGRRPVFTRHCTLSYADKEDNKDRSASTSEMEVSEEGLVSIRVTPDERGQFGFSVKGGVELNLPILVSRVAPNTPADRCYPKVHEGDQVLFINGQDVSRMLHKQVVSLIRSSRETAARELILTVRPNVYEPQEVEAPPYQYMPDVPHLVPDRADALAQSMLLLADGLKSGALVMQFMQLYCTKPGLTMNEAMKAKNRSKNRYRDICPYDCTRVILTNGATGDYINANYVNMEIAGSGIINRYIATQGPLPNTVADFWQMVAEAQSTLIVMVTPMMERGRVKCHKYWPAVSHKMELAHLHITCTKKTEEAGGSLVFRKLCLANVKTEEQRRITHIQYLAWPDHGVPKDSTGFLQFTQRVRQARAGMVEPTVVHCSAGIGRTGVLILMETAMCLIEANVPVYPLDIVRAMRDQRGMMIQTEEQYCFVCKSLHHAYTEGIVKPSLEFQT